MPVWNKRYEKYERRCEGVKYVQINNFFILSRLVYVLFLSWHVENRNDNRFNCFLFSAVVIIVHYYLTEM